MASKKPKQETPVTTQSAKKQKPDLAPKSTPVKAKAAPVKAAPAKAALVITTEAIAQRAYYIAEERRLTRTPGNPTQDWLNAETQLKAESKPKKASPKSGK